VRVSRPSRRRAAAVGLSLAATAVAGLSPGAASGTTTAKLTGRITPGITAFTTTPQSVGLTVDADFSGDGEGGLPDTITRAVVFFSHGARVNGSLFPSCDPRRLSRRRGSPSACPRGARLGGGHAIGHAAGSTEELAVSVYNGPGGRSLLFWLHGDQPADISGLIDAPLVAIASRRYGYRLTMPVPASLQQIGPDMFTQLTHFDTTVRGTVRRREHGRTVIHGYIEVLTCPPGALVPAHGDFSFLGGGTASVDSYLGCG
jgi:hypothetical protein